MLGSLLEALNPASEPNSIDFYGMKPRKNVPCTLLFLPADAHFKQANWAENQTNLATLFDLKRSTRGSTTQVLR